MRRLDRERGPPGRRHREQRVACDLADVRKAREPVGLGLLGLTDKLVEAGAEPGNPIRMSALSYSRVGAVEQHCLAPDGHLDLEVGSGGP